MNLILLHDDDFIDAERVCLRGRRLRHLQEVLGATPGVQLRVGRVDGLMGVADVLHIDEQQVQLRVRLDQPPPPKRPLTLLLALPRPKALRRILRAVAELGVERVVLLNAWKVEKSYWQSPLLTPEAIREALLDGLEQARDTVLPEVQLAPRFKPFIEDQLPPLLDTLPAETLRLLAHPGGDTPCPRAIEQPAILAVGPDGGFTPYEVGRFVSTGFEAACLGPRIQRVEHAVISLIARLYD